MNIDITGLVAYNEAFISILSGPQRIAVMTQVGKRVGAAAVRYAAEYPEPSRKPLPKIYQRTRKDGSSYMSKFKSQAQQGKVFMLGKEGKIPYRRSGTLGKSMTSSVTSVDQNSVTTEVGTNVPYGPLVIGEDQSPYFRDSSWLTLPQRMNQNANKLAEVARTAYMTEIDKRIK
jgi:hypothetical protein